MRKGGDLHAGNSGATREAGCPSSCRVRVCARTLSRPRSCHCLSRREKNLNVKNARRIKALKLVSSTVRFFEQPRASSARKKKKKKKNL